MDELSEVFDNLKISAFNKVNHVTNSVHNVTLGPDSILNSSNLKETVREICNNNCDGTKKDDEDDKNGGSKTIISYENKYKLPLKQIEQELESQRQEQVRKAINQHICKFENFTKSTQESNNDEWLIQQQNFIENFHQQEQLIIEAIQIDETRRQRDHNNELSKHYQEIMQRKLQIEQQLQQKKERQKFVENSIDNIKKDYMNFRQIYQEIVVSINSCQFIEDVKRSCLDEMKLLRALPNCFDEILNRCKNGKIIESDVCKSSEILCQLKSLQDRFNDAIKTINDRKMNEELMKQQQLDCNNLKIVENHQFISPLNLERYNEIRQFYEKHTISFQQLLNDDSLKQFRFDCKKAINIPVNAISAINSEHLNDKYMKLSNLLSGKNVIVADRQINASKHPQGIQFCMDLLAKKFILQGDLMISSNPEAAFTYSTIILSLWNDFPDFGRLILAHFYQKCPYLIPYYPMRINEQSDQEYYESLGYQYIDDKIEKQDKYLKRLTGILRLYFAMMITKPKRSQQQQQQQQMSPFNIKNAWLYLVSVLKLPPQLDVTATILHIFLEIVGYEMANVYGRCFKKLLRIIQMKFVPELKKLDAGGPVTRLEVLLENYQTTGKFEKPNGVLSVNFW